MDKKFKKQYKSLLKYYKKELDKINKFSFENSTNCMDYLSTYLRYMRDVYILKEPVIDPNSNVKLASICMAVSEYEKYSTCIDNYYNAMNGNPELKDKTKTKEETDALYSKEKMFHWNAFWEIVKINMEGWFADNDLTLQ